MGKSGKKPRQKFDPKQHETSKEKPKKEKDWGFEEIARMKGRGR